MKHKDYQDKELPLLRSHMGLPETAGLIETIKALVEARYCAEATELLFGARRDNSLITQDRIGFHLFMKLWVGQYPELILEIASNYSWSTVPAEQPTGGLSILVYPNEYFIIMKPIATKVLWAMM